MWYGNFCDKRLKTDIKEINKHFEILDELNPIDFKMTDTPFRKHGFIADELIKVYPQCVAGESGKIDKDGNPGYMCVDETGLISVLTKCVQGNKEEIKEFKLENDS